MVAVEAMHFLYVVDRQDWVVVVVVVAVEEEEEEEEEGGCQQSG